jgi:hypothetical protein
LPKKRDIIFTAKDWNGRDVVLDRQTLLAHVFLYHIDEAISVDRVKSNLSKPRIVIENAAAKSENAIYDVEIGGHPCLLVAIKQGWLKKRQIATFYGVPKGFQPPGRVIWPKKKK